MKKKTKVMTTIGIMGACAGIGMGTYMYMKKNQAKIQQTMKKYMSYPQ